MPTLPSPLTAWDTVRVHGAWYNYDGTKKAGTFKLVMPTRVTDPTNDAIIPAGTFAQGALNETAGVPSLDLRVPAFNDPDITPSGVQPILTVTFADGSATETYPLSPPVSLVGDANGVDLVNFVYPTVVPTTQNGLVRSVAGGVAGLDSAGDVINAAGTKVLPVDTSGFVPTSRTVNGKALSANVTLAKADVGLGNADNTSDVNKPVSTAQQTALDAKLTAASNLADLTNPDTALTNLGAGTAAKVNTGTTAGTIPVLGTGGVLSTARLGTGTADSTKVLGGAGAWVAASTAAPSQRVRLTADTTLSASSTTLQSVSPQLLLTIGAGEEWYFAALIDYFAGTTGKFKVGSVYSGMSIVRHTLVGLQSGATGTISNVQVQDLGASGAAAAQPGWDTMTVGTFRIEGVIVGAAGGTYELKFAQNVSDATAPKVLAGTHIFATQWA